MSDTPTPTSHEDMLNCRRLDEIRLALDRLFLARQSGRCNTKEKVRIARANTLRHIGEILAPDWRL